MKTPSLKGILALLISGIALLALNAPLADLAKGDLKLVSNAEEFARVLDDKTRRAQRSLHFLQVEMQQKNSRRVLYSKSAYLRKQEETHGIHTFVFQNDSLRLWSGTRLSPGSVLRAARQGREVHQFENGWFRLLYLTDGIDEYIAAIHLRDAYPYQNEFLEASFASDFDLEGLRGISISPEKGAVKLKATHQYFYLFFDENTQRVKYSATVFVSLSVLGALLCLLALTFFFSSYGSRYLSYYSLFLLVAVVIALRLWSINASWPYYVHDSEWFNPTLYASSKWSASLSDFLINSVILLGLALAARYLYLPHSSFRRPGTIVQLLLLAALFAYATFVNYMLKGLVLNSKIPFNINVLTEIDPRSVAGLFGTGAMYFSFLLLADALVIYANRYKAGRRQWMILMLMLASILHIACSHFVGIKDLIFVLWPSVLIGLLLYLRCYAPKVQLSLGHAVLISLLLATVSSHNFIKYKDIRDQQEKEMLVEKLVLNNDPIAELLFPEVGQRLARDPNIRRVFKESDLHTRQVLEGYIIQRYFSGYWSNYDVEIFPFLGDSSAWGKLSPSKPRALSEFLKMATEFGEEVNGSDMLYFMPASRELTRYIAILPLHYELAPEPDGFFVILMSSKSLQQSVGFPALLVDAGMRPTTSSQSKSFSVAKYVDGTLRSSTGEYVYRRRAGPFANMPKYPGFIVKNNYKHLVAAPNPFQILVVSSPLITWVDRLSVVSYISGFFGLILALALVAKHLISGKRVFLLSFNQKIQALLILLSIASMLLFALATRFYIEKNFTEKNERQIREKMQSILREVQEQVDQEERLNFQMAEYLNRMLSQLAYVFYSDIHFYASDGSLLASSQMRMFNEGLVSRQMSPAAFANLDYLERTSYLHEERIGGLRYTSAYAPVYNREGIVLGYINLPYFARQSELNQEIADFFEAIVNVFILLLILAVLVGLFVSQWITSPLTVIRQSLGAIDLGRSNRIIGYRARDEIGLLVAEYNAKVAELEHHAEKLAQSERESAWREMAKQVAHEIKNPLTPMKLNIQHLQRLLEQGNTLSSEQVQRLTNNLIEQIDGLSNIANSFSSFAKMPQSQPVKLDLCALLRNSISLYDSMDDVKIQLDLGTLEEAVVYSDKEQLIRLLNNLIKNAIQAIPEDRKGRIDLRLSTHEEGYLIRVRDNGKGIDPGLKEKIFMPNFTTKSRGMGLGLAMCKSIVETNRGKIWFESIPGSGSSFFVWLPPHSEEG